MRELVDERSILNKSGACKILEEEKREQALEVEQ